MTVVSRSLDDLDRLAFRLSRTVRTQYPQLLTQGFTLTDLEERLLPFREVRRELANAGADAFESSLLRLISGERGYLSTETSLQTACRNALLLPSPSMSLVRTWSSTHLRLVSPAATPAASTAPADELFPMPATMPSTMPTAARPGTPAATDPALAMGLTAAAPALVTAAACCRYCDNRLPQARAVTFCPHCGMDLTKRHCPACSTELEVEWKHCVTCGRKE